MRRFEFVDGTSAKFWEIEVVGTDVTVRFGKIGTDGQAKTKSHASAAAAEMDADKLVREKTGKGYVETGTAPKAAPKAKAASKKADATGGPAVEMAAFRGLKKGRFFEQAGYGELTLTDGEPDGCHHYRSAPDGEVWGSLFDEIDWIGEEADGGLVGWLRGTDQVVMLDNEGSFSTTGRTLVDHLASRYFDDEPFTELLDFCKKAGLPAPLSEAARAKSLKGCVDLEKRFAERKAAAAKKAPKTAGVRPVDRYPLGCALGDGRLLVLSCDDAVTRREGYDSTLAFAFDPKSTSFSRVADLPLRVFLNGRLFALADGRALLVRTGDEPACAVYDPAANRWEVSATCGTGHGDAPVALLRDGRALVISGGGLDQTDEVHAWSAAKGWKAVAAHPAARNQMGAVGLADGRVLTLGGLDDEYAEVKLAEVYDPVKDVWRKAAKAPFASSTPAMHLLPDGRVLAMQSDERAVYDAKKDAWQKLKDDERASGVALALPGGRFAVFGYRGTSLMDGATFACAAAGSTLLPRGNSTLAWAMPDGRVLLVGGDLFHNHACEPEIWDPKTGAGSPLPGLEKALDKQSKDLAKHRSKAR
jgi:predicted DNA-binding WGR domain protein